jgi:hypothetical protein
MAAAARFDKTKTPPPVWQWGSINLVNESEPDRRAAKQRVQQQVQFQITVHRENLFAMRLSVNRKIHDFKARPAGRGKIDTAA